MDSVLILRSAPAERVRQTRTSVRASRRMRTNDSIRPHASRRIAAGFRGWETVALAWRCDAPQHEGGRAAFGLTEAMPHVRQDARRERNPHVQWNAVHCFRIVVNNENTNSGVWRLTAPLACA